MSLVKAVGKWVGDQREQIRRNQEQADLDRIAKLEAEAERLVLEEAKLNKLTALEAEVRKRREAVNKMKYPSFYKRGEE